MKSAKEQKFKSAEVKKRLKFIFLIIALLLFCTSALPSCLGYNISSMKRDIWIFLFVLGAVLFSWPVVSIFKYDLSKYFFMAWLIFIALIFFATIYSKKKNNGG